MNTPPPNVVEARKVSTRFKDLVIHEGLDLDIGQGEIFALVGGSGSGKTTLIREIVGLQVPDEGTIRLFGQAVLDPDPGVRKNLCRRFGMLFQQGALFSALSVFDNVAFPLRELHALDEAMIRDLVLMKLAMVGLEPIHGALMPAELSGGMVKRAALARALALEPELLVLDEPTAGLDPDRAASFVELIGSLQKDLKFTVVMVTHDLETLNALATHAAVLADKHLIASGPLEEVSRVDHPFIQGFFALPEDRGQKIED
ncbi:MAG: ATP-binding cassette domain-containing protein [Candidatus Accumulibacter sp.]|jgi:phospholipid/cholesterol/gamma-HCH transport system ATP-binding protein|nr:ATP-binding cassette domain-containing protein [Accumulibacter sp.]